MEDKTIVQEFMVQLQKKYSAVIEVYNMTLELEKAVTTNDQVSIQLVLEMWEEAMQNLQKCQRTVALIEDTMEVSERQWIERMRKRVDGALPRNWEEEKIAEITDNIKRALDKTVAIDKKVSLKISGKDSYYSKQ